MVVSLACETCVALLELSSKEVNIVDKTYWRRKHGKTECVSRAAIGFSRKVKLTRPLPMAFQKPQKWDVSPSQTHITHPSGKVPPSLCQTPHAGARRGLLSLCGARVQANQL